MNRKQKTSQTTDPAIAVDTVLAPVFIDCNGDEIKEGDTVHLTIQGVGDGFVEIVKHDGQLCLYDRIQGHYPLIHAVHRTDMILEIDHKLDALR
jgi:hypothetical protein